LGDLTPVGRRLESILLQQQAQIETTCNNLDYLDFLTEPAVGAARLLREIARLIDLAHALRDHMLESLVAIAGQEQRLQSLEPRLLRDAAFDAPNRAGLEAIFEEWRREDPGMQRALSVALVDVDRFGHFNETLGTLAGDRVLAAVMRMLAECIRKNRGFDRLGRFAGQQFLVFLGDTGPHEATAVVERLRQSVTATSFVLGGQEVALTLRAAATDLRPQDTMETLSRRLIEGLKVAAHGGGNRSVLDEGHGPSLVLPPTYDVRGQIIEVAEPDDAPPATDEFVGSVAHAS
jgi:diguanylate cyclase (GGDEF)-like protein